MMSTLIVIADHYQYGVNALELAEFLLAYNAYGQKAGFVFMGDGLKLLQPGPDSPLPALDKMLQALSYADNPCHGVTANPSTAPNTSLRLKWITDEQLTDLKNEYDYLLEYNG